MRQVHNENIVKANGSEPAGNQTVDFAQDDGARQSDGSNPADSSFIPKSVNKLDGSSPIDSESTISFEDVKDFALHSTHFSNCVEPYGTEKMAELQKSHTYLVPLVICLSNKVDPLSHELDLLSPATRSLWLFISQLQLKEGLLFHF